MNFSDKIKAERSKRNMNQTEFAELLGVSKHTIVNYESGKVLPRTREAAKKIADTLNVSLSYLLDMNEEFVVDTGEQYGSRGRKKAEQLMNETFALYSGGELADEDMDELLMGFQQMLLDARKKNQKYTPKKYLKKSDDSDNK